MSAFNFHSSIKTEQRNIFLVDRQISSLQTSHQIVDFWSLQYHSSPREISALKFQFYQPLSSSLQGRGIIQYAKHPTYAFSYVWPFVNSSQIITQQQVIDGLSGYAYIAPFSRLSVTFQEGWSPLYELPARLCFQVYYSDLSGQRPLIYYEQILSSTTPPVFYSHNIFWHAPYFGFFVPPYNADFLYAPPSGTWTEDLTSIRFDFVPEARMQPLEAYAECEIQIQPNNNLNSEWLTLTTFSLYEKLKQQTNSVSFKINRPYKLGWIVLRVRKKIDSFYHIQTNVLSCYQSYAIASENLSSIQLFQPIISTFEVALSQSEMLNGEELTWWSSVDWTTLTADEPTCIINSSFFYTAQNWFSSYPTTNQGDADGLLDLRSSLILNGITWDSLLGVYRHTTTGFVPGGVFDGAFIWFNMCRKHYEFSYDFYLDNRGHKCWNIFAEQQNNYNTRFIQIGSWSPDFITTRSSIIVGYYPNNASHHVAYEVFPEPSISLEPYGHQTWKRRIIRKTSTGVWFWETGMSEFVRLPQCFLKSSYYRNCAGWLGVIVGPYVHIKNLSVITL